MMTNKEYIPLTTSPDKTKEDFVGYADRLCYLENCIKVGRLIFVPRCIGDKFWVVKYKSSTNKWYVIELMVYEIIVRGYVTYVRDGCEQVYRRPEDVYWSREEAEKALEKLNG